MKVKYKILMTVASAMPFLMGCNAPYVDLTEYVVVAKGDNNIAFRYLKPSATHDNQVRILKFDEKYPDIMEYYNVIKVGDTLNFNQEMDSEFVWNAHILGKYGAYSRIYYINGKQLSYIKQMAVRDSIMQKMQKTK